MKLLSRLLVMAFLGFSATVALGEPVPMPNDQGYPIAINASVRFNHIEAIADADSQFLGEVDIRYRWKDSRLAFDRGVFHIDAREYNHEEAKTFLESIWQPDIVVANLVGEPTSRKVGVKVSHDGHVELIERIVGTFKAPMDVAKFPFDRQKLRVELVCDKYDNTNLTITYDRNDLSFARSAHGLRIDNWNLGEVDFKTSTYPSWNHGKHAKLRVYQRALRQIDSYIWPIFIPLFAVMFIPILAIWMNKHEDYDFKVETFELVNMIIGGLFSVIALNFTINAEYKALSSGDNTVISLFGLAYLLIGAALLINLVVFKSTYVKEKLGKYLIAEIYAWLSWAIPAVALFTSMALFYAVMP